MRLLVFLIGCTAITDFNQFSAGDLSMPPMPQPFGAMCDRNQTNACVAPTGAMRALQCLDQLDGKVVTGNICTRDCLMGPAACTDYPNATCAQIGGPLMPNYCVPNCNLPSTPCRQGLTCCSDTGQVTSGAGVCKPGC